ncbi:DUF2243 domain-containing protein [Neobacillus drentensis]
MGLHQIRYDVNIVPYDMVWYITSVLMIIIGIALLARSRRKFSKTGVTTNHANN